MVNNQTTITNQAPPTKDKNPLFKKLISWVKSNKKAVFVLIFIPTVLLIVSSWILFKRKEQKPDRSIQTPQPTSFVRQLTVASIFPSSGATITAGTTNAISLFFDTQVNLETVKVQSIPQLEFSITTLPDFPDRVLVVPKTPWKEGVAYKIKVLKGIRALVENRELEEDIVLEYKTEPFSPPVYQTLPGQKGI